jgi:hypothetical protein
VYGRLPIGGFKLRLNQIRRNMKTSVGNGLIADAGGYGYSSLMRTILIRLPTHQSEQFSLIHRLRNYGEDVYRYTRDNDKGVGEVDLDEVDAATTEFSVRGVADSKVRRVRQWLEEEAARQNLEINTEVL